MYYGSLKDSLPSSLINKNQTKLNLINVIALDVTRIKTVPEKVKTV